MPGKILEGAWEEILDHAAELAEKRLRLVVLSESSPAGQCPLSGATLGIVGTIDSTDLSQHGYSAGSFPDIIAEKFRAQGLKIP